MADGDNELPGYTTRAAAPAAAGTARTEHKYSLESNGRPWLSIYVSSRSPSASSAPFFLEGDTISGRVELNLEKAEGLKGISIAVGLPSLLLRRVYRPSCM